jgi:hypothetical protein
VILIVSAIRCHLLLNQHRARLPRRNGAGIAAGNPPGGGVRIGVGVAATMPPVMVMPMPLAMNRVP